MFMSSFSSVLCWTCRGAAGRAFAFEVKELMREYRPKIIILLEPRISGDTADRVCKIFG